MMRSIVLCKLIAEITVSSDLSSGREGHEEGGGTMGKRRGEGRARARREGEKEVELGGGGCRRDVLLWNSRR